MFTRHSGYLFVLTCYSWSFSFVFRDRDSIKTELNQMNDNLHKWNKYSECLSLLLWMHCKKKKFSFSLQYFLMQQTLIPGTLQVYLLQCRRFPVITKKDIEFFNSPVPRNCQFIFEIIDSVTHEIIQWEPIPGQPCFSRFCGTPCIVHSYSTYLLFWQYFAAMA